MSVNKWVLFINYHSYPCKVGGLEVFNYYLTKELSKYYNIHQLTFCDDYENKKNITYHILTRIKFLKLSGPLQIFWFLFKNKNKIELLHLSFSKAYWTHWFVYVVAKKIFGVKYIMTIHGGSLASWNPELPYKLFYKNAEYITGVSDRIIKEYTKRSYRKIIFTPPLIPFNIISPKNKFRDKWRINQEEKVLLYVGSLKPLKSVDTLIEALGLITYKKLKKYNLKVLIIGDGVSRNNLEKRVKELELQEIVKFLGIIDRKMVNQLYNLADLYTICSEFEGLPISLLEAFANKLPCITSDAPGLIDVSLNNKNTVLFKTKDYCDYASKIELLLNDSELQNRIKNDAYEYFKLHYSYDKLLDTFINIIDSVKKT